MASFLLRQRHSEGCHYHPTSLAADRPALSRSPGRRGPPALRAPSNSSEGPDAPPTSGLGSALLSRKASTLGFSVCAGQPAAGKVGAFPAAHGRWRGVRIRTGAGPGREARGRWDPAGEQARVRGPGAVAGLGGVGGARAPRVRNPPSGGEAGFVRLLVGGLLGATKRRVVGLLPPGVLSRVWAQPVLSKADSKGPRSEGGWKVRQAGLPGWGCGKASEGWSPPEGRGVAHPGRWLGPCCSLQDDGGTAPREGLSRGAGLDADPGSRATSFWPSALSRFFQA